MVSERGESLSPKYAPEIIAPATKPGENPSAVPMPNSATPMVAIVDQELPVDIDITALIRTVANRKIFGFRISKPYTISIGTTPLIIQVPDSAPISSSISIDVIASLILFTINLRILAKETPRNAATPTAVAVAIISANWFGPPRLLSPHILILSARKIIKTIMGNKANRKLACFVF